MTKRTVFITGGASGIGFGIAQAMSKAGHHVIIADINEQAAQRAASDILKENGSASAIEVDVCNAQQVAMPVFSTSRALKTSRLKNGSN